MVANTRVYGLIYSSEDVLQKMSQEDEGWIFCQKSNPLILDRVSVPDKQIGIPKGHYSERFLKGFFIPKNSSPNDTQVYGSSLYRTVFIPKVIFLDFF